jgi:hypothetical protein
MSDFFYQTEALLDHQRSQQSCHRHRLWEPKILLERTIETLGQLAMVAYLVLEMRHRQPTEKNK